MRILIMAGGTGGAICAMSNVDISMENANAIFKIHDFINSPSRANNSQILAIPFWSARDAYT